MMPAANQGVGMNMGFPDVCTTPAAPAPVPIPYPNIGMNAMSVPFVPNVLVSMAPGHNMAAKPTLTNGDNAGVAHPLFMQPGGTTMGNPTILMGGMPAAHLCVPTYGNNFNNPVGAKIVPSVTNVLMSSTAFLPTPTQTQRQLRDSLHRVRYERGGFRHTTDGLLHLHLPCISLLADRWLAQCLRKQQAAMVRGIVLDLRTNPGGATLVAMLLARQLLDTALPIAVLVSRRTASAAELLAARLQDGGNARIFGERSYGKATAEFFACDSGGLTATGTRLQFLRWRGDNLDCVGVTPDEPCDPQHACTLAKHWLSRNPSNRS